MHLLHTRTLQLHRFLGDDLPSYAILSHTWGKDEIQYHDVSKLTGRIAPIAGFSKIQKCCLQAELDGFEYVWIDTCCINSESSAELSEAINSMYQWYKAAKVCYAYLADVAWDEKEFGQSRWFTRGWTLQELLAPDKLIFFDRDWNDIGSKWMLRSQISSATGIQGEHLNRPLNASIAQKMSWVSKRKTTRTEDVAYCLLGLFDVNMPLLYGEGERKAFLRLQQEIIKISSDESIFAWTNQKLWSSGMFAQSPADFYNSGDITLATDVVAIRPPYSLTNLGLEIELGDVFVGLVGESDSLDQHIDVITPLACRRADQYWPLALRLKIIEPKTRHRTEANAEYDRKPIVAMRTHLDVLSQCSEHMTMPGTLRKRGFGRRLFIADLRSTKSMINIRKLRLQGQWKQSKLSLPKIRSYQKQQPPQFILWLSPRVPESLILLPNPKSSPDKATGLESMYQSFANFRESSSGLAFQNEDKTYSLALSWHFTSGWLDDSPDEIVLDVYHYKTPVDPQEVWQWDSQGREPCVLRSDGIFSAGFGPRHFIWITMRKAESQYEENKWIVEIDIANVEGISQLGY